MGTLEKQMIVIIIFLTSSSLGIEGHRQSFHKVYYEKYIQQKKDLAELRAKNCYKRGSQRLDIGSNLKQQKPELAGVNKMVQV